MSGQDYWNSVPKAPAEIRAAALSCEQQIIDDAIARGTAASMDLISARDALFPLFRRIMNVPGCNAVGLLACIMGVYTAVTQEAQRGPK